MYKIAVSILEQGEGLSAPMDERFGRAARFLLVDRDGGDDPKVIVNSNAGAAHGAGTGSAAVMQDHGVEAVISGRFGPKAFDTLQAMKIQCWTAPPGLTAREALDRFRDGKLERMELKTFR